MTYNSQADSVVDCPEFRTLLLYCGRELRDGDIPHRRSIGRLVVEAFKECYSKLIKELSVSTYTYR
jgi:hypothetical protein